MMGRVLNWIAERGPLAVAASIFVALAFPGLAAVVRPVLPVSVFCMLTIALIRTDTRMTRDHVFRPRLILLGVAWAMIALPALFALSFAVFEPSPPVALGLILLATAPATVSSPAMAQLLRLDGSFALAALLVASVLTPFTVPAITEFVLDADLAITTGELALRLVVLIGGAAACAFVLRRGLGERRRRAAEPAFDVMNVGLMALFATAAMDGVTDAFVSDPGRTLMFLGLAFALNLGALAVTAALFWRAAGPRRAMTIGFGTANRNMALSISALAGHVHPDTWLFFALVQFPIYLTPVMLKPITRRILARAGVAAQDPAPRSTPPPRA
jgi:BASS family bile acid:Na+ symporter